MIEKHVVQPEARKREPYPRDVVKIRSPQRKVQPPEKIGWITLMLSSAAPLVMGIAFLQSNTNPVIGILGILSAVLLPGAQLLKNRQEIKQHETNEAARINDYRQYLKDKKEEIITFGQEQQRVVWQDNPTVSEMMRRVGQRSAQFWQRMPGDEDFVAVRVGKSNLPISIEIIIPDREMADEPLVKEAHALCEEVSTVPDLPVICALEQVGTLGIRGHDGDANLEAANNIVAQLVAHHSPKSLHLYIVSHRLQAADYWQWARWLPHLGLVQGQKPNVRLSFRPEDDDKMLSSAADLLQRRLDDSQNGRFFPDQAAHCLFIFDQLNSLHHQVIQLLLANQPQGRQPSPLRASAIFIERMPPQVQSLLEIQEKSFEYSLLVSGATQKPIRGVIEQVSSGRMEKFARSMAPLRVEALRHAGSTTLPGNVRLVELLGATQPAEINLKRLYSQRYDPNHIMAFPIGINRDLKTQQIVLREDGRGGFGPHAMLAGATGKGKSVTLQSIVLSLAATNSPAHLNIVLADFKGGASELARLKNLPHVVGFVTDLDESYVERFRLSLEGEVRRRKYLLEETPALIGRQVPDIYEYNQALPDRILPHLVVVIDEFAKALQINPAFQITLDKDIAAQGRALGVHLILSTQKAADFTALRPNLEVRMSMQVQNPEDSRIIFNRTDAYSQLNRAGQAFLQVGDNRIFAMFQVAHTQVPYQENGSAIDLVDDFKIRQMLADGSMKLLYAHEGQSMEKSGNGRYIRYETEILVEHIRDYCLHHYAPARQICLPPLPAAEKISLGDLLTTTAVYRNWMQNQGWTKAPAEKQRRLVVPLGMLDLPAQQRQQPFILDLNHKDGNFLVVGTAQSGKALFLRTLTMSLAATHTPEDLLFYFHSRDTGLALFEDLPHCQAFIQPTEGERISRLLTFLESELDRRTTLLRQTRASHFHALRQSRQDLSLPTLVIVIENFAGFIADQFERLKEVVNLVAAARQVDMHFIVTTTSLSGVHAKVQQHFQNRLALGATSTLDVFVQRSKPLPEIHGRGYVQLEQALVVCQLASPHWQTPGDYRDVIKEMKTQWQWPGGERPLPPIQTLPKSIDLETLWQHNYSRPSFIKAPTAPLGVDYALDDVYLDFKLIDSYNLVVGPAQSGKTRFLITLVLSAAVNFRPRQLKIVVIAFNKPRSPIRLLRQLPHVDYADNPAMAQHILTSLKSDLQEQSQFQKEIANKAPEDLSAITNRIPQRTLIFIDDGQNVSRHTSLNQLLDDCMVESSTIPIHLFVSDSGNNLNQAKQAFNVKYLQSVCRHGSGLLFSTDQNDLALLNLMGKVNSTTLKRHGPDIGHGRGFWTFQGDERIVQIALPGAGDEHGDYEAAVNGIIDAIIEKHPPASQMTPG